MKGIIFSSFMEFADKVLGEDFVEDMIDQVKLTTGGAYTTVGNYPASELTDLVQYVVAKNNLDAKAIMVEFGEFTFFYLANHYPRLLKDYKTAFECIYHVDQVIHQNVIKLYADAELPHLHVNVSDDKQQLFLEYSSDRPFMLVVYGLIKGCTGYYKEKVAINMTDLSNGKGNHAKFVVNYINEHNSSE